MSRPKGARAALCNLLIASQKIGDSALACYWLPVDNAWRLIVEIPGLDGKDARAVLAAFKTLAGSIRLGEGVTVDHIMVVMPGTYGDETIREEAFTL